MHLQAKGILVDEFVARFTVHVMVTQVQFAVRTGDKLLTHCSNFVFAYS